MKSVSTTDTLTISLNIKVAKTIDLMPFIGQNTKLGTKLASYKAGSKINELY
ncbi:hypothetical protein HU838_003057 [Listeria monocytogenes]|nr:hypothetical protein [Listeria monocytogenes]EEO6184191.1 hypothetical protein [Listeria monocytogenes]EFT8854493.1 hypothetical protein [Listeria monocytogenes]EFT8903426.1 hypothetical protein [Listeria monocytogenes]EJF3452393.1 hypothetical protein [Listeria monocytogenes]